MSLQISDKWEASAWLWAVSVPIAVYLLIVFLKPSFVDRETPARRRNSRILWTIILTLVIWTLFFTFAKCKNC